MTVTAIDPVDADALAGLDALILKRMLATLPNGVVLLDAAGEIIFVNLQARALLDLAQNQVPGRIVIQPTWQVIHEDGATFPPDDYPWEITLRTGHERSGVIMGILRPEHGPAWIDLSSSVVARSDNGTVSAVQVVFTDVTERKTAEARAAEAHRQTFAVLESIGDAFYALDCDFRFTYFNVQAERLLRSAASALLGRTVWEVFPEAMATVIFDVFHRVMSHGDPSTIELYYPPFDSWFEARAFPSTDGISVYFRDISESHRVGKALAAREEQYRALVEQVPAVIYTVRHDEDGAVDYVSPYIETLLGIPPDEFLADPGIWARAIHPEDHERMRALMVQTRATGERFRAEYRLIAVDGRTVWVDDTAELVADEDGQSTLWHGVALDITDHKVSQMKLVASEERFRSLVQHAADLISVINADGSIQYQSPALEHLLGYRREDRVGENGLSFLHPDDAPLVRQMLARLATMPGQTTMAVLRAQHKDGSWRTLEATVTNLLEEPSIRGFVVNSRDITDRTVLEQDLRQREARHRALLAAIPDLIVRFDRAGTYLDIEAKPSISLVAPVGALLGRTVADVMPPEAAGFMMSAITQALDDRQMQTLNYPLWQETATREIEARIVAAGENDVVVLARDVTDQREASEQLRKSEERLRLALEAAEMGAWDLHIPTDTVVWSPTLCTQLGLPAETYTTTSAAYRATFVHPANQEDAPALHDQAAEGAEFWDLECQIQRPTGERRWLRDVGRVVEWNADGSPLRAVGVTIDITARRMAEQEVRFQAELLDQATVAVIATDPAGIVTHWNHHAETLYGWPRVEVIGQHIGVLAIGQAEVVTTDAIVVHTGAGAVWEGDLVGRRKDGSEVPVHVVVSPVCDANGVMVASVGISVDISAQQATQALLRYQATHDPLTGLPNRALFTDRLRLALADTAEHHRSVNVLYLDLDGFKRVNDSFGHAIGDELLVAVGQRLAAGLDPGATLARFGGDEFTVLLPSIDDPCDVAEIAGRLLDQVRMPFTLDGRETFIDASIGIAQSSPALARSGDLLRAADIALYQAKAAGRGTYRIFERDLAAHMPDRLELESELRHALERGELRVYFQPEVDLKTGEIVGAEALVRWQHPRRGLLAPSEFIAIAEESDLIVPIGGWVLAEACRQTAIWRALGPAMERLTVSVNLTARQLRQPGLIAQIQTATRDTGLSLRQLKLEITERTVIEDAQGEINALAHLRRLGIKIAIDDFGTGYSSLGYLLRWPVDTIKIDRSFVGGIGTKSGGQGLVDAMASLARALDAEVVAEGIETAAQLDWLRGIGIERGQGFFFARPLPADEFVRLLESGNRYDVGTVNDAIPRFESPDERARLQRNSSTFRERSRLTII